MPIENESHAIDEVVERLRSRYPDTPELEVRAQVEAQLEKFTDAVVRDFVPVLVEHEAGGMLARQQLRDDA
jgi:hypothetical protein